MRKDVWKDDNIWNPPVQTSSRGTDLLKRSGGSQNGILQETDEDLK